jgi:hypothetical protein
MKLGEYYQLIRHCGCGSGLISSWYKDEKGVDVKACERCIPNLLYKIFDDRYLDLFQNWIDNMFAETNPGWEWVWEDLLKEKGCEQVIGLEDAKRKCESRILIKCPNGPNIYRRTGDNSVHILVPRDYAEQVLKAGKMV